MVSTSWFPHCRVSKPITRTVSWARLAERLTKPGITTDKKRTPAWCPATFDGNRAKANTQQVSCLVWDYDDGTEPHDALAPWLDFNLCWHTSFSHTDETPKFRIIIPLKQPVKGEHWSRVWKHYAQRCAGGVDAACSDSSRLYLLPFCPSETLHMALGESHQGELGFLEPDPRIWEVIEKPAHRPVTNWHARERLKSRGKRDPALMECSDARLNLAKHLDANISGDRARHIKCPRCARNSVWFFIDPENPMKTARCNHQGAQRCSWYGHLGDLAS